ncbi:MAG: hypothetical protein QME66_04150 [Candidatus Eisenbacteria bacterium]|nr:hypothetical protein [Candidatus Eisenbacteria bacterium]
MSTLYPGALDALADPAAADVLGTAAGGIGVAAVMTNLNDAVEAIETKLGTGSSTAISGTVLRGTGAGASAFGAITNADLPTAISGKTYDGLTITTTTGTLTLTNSKTLSVSNTLTFDGTDGTTFTFPSTTGTVVTLAATQTLTNKTLTAPVIASITNTSHITLTPGASSFVKIAALIDENTATSYQSNTVILTGWGRVDTPGSPAVFMSETVTFGITFSTTPFVVISATGGRSSTATPATAYTENVFATASSIGTTSFVATVQRGDATNLQASIQYAYQWVAIGQLN